MITTTAVYNPEKDDFNLHDKSSCLLTDSIKTLSSTQFEATAANRFLRRKTEAFFNLEVPPKAQDKQGPEMLPVARLKIELCAPIYIKVFSFPLSG